MSDFVATQGPIPVEDIARRSDAGRLLVLRWVGAWIDFVALILFLAAAQLVLGERLYDETLYILLGALILYFPVTEGIWGRSLGKLITGTIVVDSSGRAPGMLKAGLRTVARIVEVNPLLAGGLPAGIVLLLSKRRQRLGDMLARTYVVRARDLAEVRRK